MANHVEKQAITACADNMLVSAESCLLLEPSVYPAEVNTGLF